MKRNITMRRYCQWATLLLFCALPWVNTAGLQQIRGSLFSLNFFGIPFADPVAALQMAAEGILPAGPLLWGAVCSLAAALVLGRVFCSWICPYGFFSEQIHALAVRRKKTPQGTEHGQRQGRAFAAKSFILLLGLLPAALLGYPALHLLAMPGELSLIPLLVWQGAGAALLLFSVPLPAVVLLLEAVSGKRFWCRHVCPQSVLLGAAARCLPAKAPGLRIAWRAAHCTCKKAKACRAACSLELDPRRRDGPDRRDCTACGDCLRACATCGGALRWRVLP